MGAPPRAATGESRAGARSSLSRELEVLMDEPVYVSRVRIERVKGPLRRAFLPVEEAPVLFGVHSEIAAHYGIDSTVHEPHAATLDYLVAAAAG
jgi:hypothetical protein